VTAIIDTPATPIDAINASSLKPFGFPGGRAGTSAVGMLPKPPGVMLPARGHGGNGGDQAVPPGAHGCSCRPAYREASSCRHLRREK
jgi:hypothetical protein